MESVVSSVADRNNTGKGRPGDTGGRDANRRAAQGDAATASRHTVDEAADVLGLTEIEVPPAVQGRIATLMAEVERLRAELVQVRHHETLLLEQADQHPALPVLHRRAFLREVGRLLAQTERRGLPGSLLYLHIGGCEALRDAHGLEANQAALVHVAELLRTELEPAEAVGYLDNGDFALALTMVTEEETKAREKRIADRLAASPFLWNGMRPSFSYRFGRTAFRVGANAEELLASAEASRRRPLGA